MRLIPCQKRKKKEINSVINKIAKHKVAYSGRGIKKISFRVNIQTLLQREIEREVVKYLVKGTDLQSESESFELGKSLILFFLPF